jgi:ABC-type transport system involved in multi-copper enzyme maturation permease subunit
MAYLSHARRRFRRSWLARNLAYVPIALWLGFAYYHRSDFGLEILFAGLLLGGLALILTGRRRAWLSPVFTYDLVRTARHGQQQSHRFLFGIFLALVLYLTYTSFYSHDLWHMTRSVRMSRQERSVLAWAFVSKVLVLQYVAVLLVTPAYVAGVLPHEKQRRTLEFMLTTDLSNREIVLGVLASRLANLGQLVLTGLPVITFLEFLGGVDPQLVLVTFALIFFTMLSVGSLSVLVSIFAERPTTAIFQSYLWIFLLTLGTSCIPGVNLSNPFAVLFYVGQELDDKQSLNEMLMVILVVGALWHGFLCVVFCRWTIREFRKASLGYQPPPIPPPKQSLRRVSLQEGRGWGPYPLEPMPERRAKTPPSEATEAIPLLDVVELPPESEVEVQECPNYRYRLDEASRRRRRRVGDDALLWKETGSQLTRERIIRWFRLGLGDVIVAVSFVFLLIFHIRLDEWRGPRRADATDPANVALRGINMAALFLFLFVAAVRAAGRVSREREQQTLDTLRTVPVEASDILVTKFLGSIWDILPGFVCLAFFWVVGLLVASLHAAALPLLIAACLVYLCFMTTLGLWLSTHLGTSLRATLLTILCSLILLTNVINFIARANQSSSTLFGDDVQWFDRLYGHVVSPVQVLWTVSFSSTGLVTKDGRESSYPDILAAVVALHLYMAITALMWLSMLRRFEAEKGPPPQAEVERPASATQELCSHV